MTAQHSGRTIGRYLIDKRTLMITSAATQRLELPECIEDVPYGRVRMGLVTPDTVDAYIEFYEDIISGKPEGTVMFQKQAQQGWRWISAHSTTIFSQEGRPVSAIISFIDVTDQNEKDAIYARWQQSLENRPIKSYSLFRCDLSQNSSFDSTEGRLISFPYEEGKALTFDECTILYAERSVYQEDREEYIESLKADRLKGYFRRGKKRLIMEYREIVDANQFRWIRRSVDLVARPDAAGIIAYLMFENIDKSKREELDTRTQAEKDALTGLLNRKAFEERLNQAIKSRDKDSLIAFFILDLDGFKQVNDTLGHIAGDQVLVETSQMIHSALWDCDLVGRLGGDEFIFCILNVQNRDIISKRARRIWRLTHRKINDSVSISSSIGIAVCPDDGVTFDELYYKADKALYTIKDDGKYNYGFYKEHYEDK